MQIHIQGNVQRTSACRGAQSCARTQEDAPRNTAYRRGLGILGGLLNDRYRHSSEGLAPKVIHLNTVQGRGDPLQLRCSPPRPPPHLVPAEPRRRQAVFIPPFPFGTVLFKTAARKPKRSLRTSRKATIMCPPAPPHFSLARTHLVPAGPRRRQHGQQSAHQEALPGVSAPLQPPFEAVAEQAGDHQRQDGHGGAVLGHQRSHAGGVRVHHDQPGLDLQGGWAGMMLPHGIAT